MAQSQKNRKKQSHIRQMAARVLAGLLAVCCVLSLISLVAGRKAERPKLTAASLLNGGYMEEYETYFSERFLAGGALSSVGGSVEAAFGKQEANGIFRGKDHFLTEGIRKADQEAISATIQSLADFSMEHYNLPVYLMLVPDAAGLYPEKFPVTALTQDQTAQFAQIQKQLEPGITWVDAGKALKEHKKEDIYYRTERYWTALGACYGYEALAEAMGLDALTRKCFAVDNDFTGSLARESGFEKGYGETVYVCLPEKESDDVSVLVENMDTGSKMATCYDTLQLEKRQKYDLYLGGDCGMLDIRTNADSEERLLVFRDSYANALLPYLAPHYREIVVIDPDLYAGDLQSLLDGTRFSAVLCLYGGNDFVTQDKISGLLESTLEQNAGAGTDDADAPDETAPDADTSDENADEADASDENADDADAPDESADDSGTDGTDDADNADDGSGEDASDEDSGGSGADDTDTADEEQSGAGSDESGDIADDDGSGEVSSDMFPDG